MCLEFSIPDKNIVVFNENNASMNFGKDVMNQSKIVSDILNSFLLERDNLWATARFDWLLIRCGMVLTSSSRNSQQSSRFSL